MINALVIECPWPPADLSPNKRNRGITKGARMAFAAKARVYRQDCYKAALESGAAKFKGDAVNVKITFHKPDARRRDDDNIIGSFKSGRDGIADAIGIDDHFWNVEYAIGSLIHRPHGKVVVEINVI